MSFVTIDTLNSQNSISVCSDLLQALKTLQLLGMYGNSVFVHDTLDSPSNVQRNDDAWTER